MLSRHTVILTILILIVGISLWGWNLRQKQDQTTTPEKIITPVEAGPLYRQEQIDIHSGDTFVSLLSGAGLKRETINEILAIAEDDYNLAQIKPGHKLVLFFASDRNDLQKLYYQISNEEELIVEKKSEGWQVKRQDIPYQIKLATVSGTIDTSLYESAKQQGLEDSLIISLANIFQWSIDFAYQVKAGDQYKFIYEKRFLDGKYVMPGRILAAQFINNGRVIRGFYFQGERSAGYFDQDGNSLRKAFLKAPVAYKYISSGFTTGRRYVQAFNITTGHRAIDYAARYGTPIRAVADGIVIFAGWQGSYGRKVSIRHNDIYTTNYAHMSKIIVKRGQRVKQGEVIGYVGSSGLSTGPHVHYELVKRGVKINPLTADLPPGEPISDVDRQGFRQVVNNFSRLLDE